MTGDAARSLPVTVLSGFLGAGKTTLLRRILADPGGVRFGVLVNDFGAINIDADLVVAAGADQVALANGCICCTIRDDLVAALQSLVALDPPPEHLLIETSGVSRPLAVVDALLAPALGHRLAIDGVFCLVDAAGFGELDYEATELAIDQAAAADVIVVNKCDIASAEDLEALESTLLGPLPKARLLRARFAEVPRAILFGLDRPAARDAAPRHPRAHDHARDHGEEFEAWSWRSAAALDEGRFRAALRRLPTSLLRAKGILLFAERPRECAVFQLVGRRSAVSFEEGPPAEASAIVAIARRGALDGDTLARLLDDCTAERQPR